MQSKNKLGLFDAVKSKNEEYKKKIKELEEEVARLKDSESLHAQLQEAKKDHTSKTSALMKNITELQSHNKKLNQQTKEHKRSQLIEKLKIDIAQQETVIDALRELIGNEDACDEAILKHLNKGPPRVRHLSREEMRIEIRKLKAQIGGVSSSRRRTDQALKDLEYMLSHHQNNDQQQSEKITQLQVSLESFRKELIDREKSIEDLSALVEEKDEEITVIRERLTELAKPAERIANLEKEVERITAELKRRDEELIQNGSVIQEQTKTIEELKKILDSVSSAKNSIEKELASIKVSFSTYQQEATANAGSLSTELSEARAVIQDLEIRLEESLKNSTSKVESYREIISQKDSKIGDLEVIIQEKDEEIDRLREEMQTFERKDTDTAIDIEIEVLRHKVSQLSKTSNAPDSLLQAEREEAKQYKTKVIELTKELASLQEYVEYLENALNESQKQTSAMYLAAKNSEGIYSQLPKSPPPPPPQPKPEEDSQAKITREIIEKLREENKQLRGSLRNKDLSITELQTELKNTQHATDDLRSSLKQTNFKLDNLNQQIFQKAAEEEEKLDYNKEVREEIVYNLGGLYFKRDLVVPDGYSVKSLVSRSKSIANNFLSLL